MQIYRNEVEGFINSFADNGALLEYKGDRK